MQIVVADDGLVGVPRKDLRKMVEAVMRRYTDYYMDIAPGKTKMFGVGGRAGERNEEVEGRTILVEREVMQHLGAVMPLAREVKLTKKTAAKLESVHALWAQESEIPIAVCREQHQAEVLGGLRHQQQVARVPEKIAGE